MASPLMLPAAALFVAAAVTAALAAAGTRFRDAVGADWFVATMGLATVWIFVAAAGYLAVDPTHVVVLEVLATILSLGVPVVWFTFVLAYTGRGHMLTRRMLLALWAIPAVAYAALLTIPAHDLYYENLTVVNEGGRVYVSAEPGPIALLGAAYVLVLFLLGLALLVGMVTGHDRLYSGQGLWLLAGTLVPVGVAILEIAGLFGGATPAIPASIAVLGLAYAYGLSHHRFLDLTPASRRIGAEEAFDDLAEGVVVVDTDWDVVSINESACDQFDCSKHAVLGDDVARVEPGLRFDDPQPGTRDIEHGGRLHEVTTSTVEDARDRHVGYALVVRDVTRQRGRKQRLEVLNRILRHNVRNDMTVIQGYATELGTRGDDTAGSMATAIEEKAEDLLSMTEKTRDIERTITTGETDQRAVAVADLFASMVEEFRERYPARQFDVDVPTGLTVHTDAPTLELVVENLVENAVVHGIPEDTAPADAPPVRLSARCVDRGLEVTVADDGPGVPSAELAVIERGTETDLEHCSGLGLWLVHWGATRMGADLTFDTTDGTTVRLVVPDK